MEEKIGFKEVFIILTTLFAGFFMTSFGLKYAEYLQQQKHDEENQQYLEELNHGK